MERQMEGKKIQNVESDGLCTRLDDCTYVRLSVDRLASLSREDVDCTFTFCVTILSPQFLI